MQRHGQRLLRRIAILAVLVTSVILITAERQTNTVLAVDYCGYCSSFNTQCENACTVDYNNCVSNGGFDCSSEYNHCQNECEANHLFCTTFCDTGGGGGGGPYPKGTCGADCYDDRGDCLLGDPPPYWIEDCLNNGGTRHTCCNEVFYDCMAGCP